MIRRFLALALLAALAACGQTPSAPVNVDDAAKVRAVVRDYLINDPSVMQEALDALADRREKARNDEITQGQHDVAIGPANAPITIVEFFDYRCPYCHAAMEWAFETMRTRRDVRFVFKEFPVLGPESMEASKAAIASIPQGKYREFHRALMSYRGDLTSEAIDQVARSVGIDAARMRRDMESPDITAILDKNHELASEAGVQGTPAFLINGEWVHGFNRDALATRMRAVTEEVRQAQR